MLNFLFKIANFCRKLYWKIFKPITLGIRIVLEYKNEILLVKTRYGNQWYLPGGNVRKRETPFNAIKRELKEECGIILNQAEIVGIYSNFVESKNDHIILFTSKVSNKNITSGLEIELCQFFFINSLPVNISPGTHRRMEEYKNNHFIGGLW